MAAGTEFDYYYGDESNQFSFYRIPRQLVTGERFKRLSTDAKLLYGLLLDRMGLSAKNGWYDEAGRVYIYYTLDEIQSDLSCGHEKAVKLLAELDKGKGFGLIERVKQGQGRPSKIYVKRFTTRAIPPRPADPDPEPSPRPPIIRSLDFRKSEVQTSENRKSRLPKTGSADFRKSDASYIKSNQTDSSYTNPSIHLSPSGRDEGWIDRYDCQEEIKTRIGYELLCQRYEPEDVDGIVDLIADTLTTTRPTLRIGGEIIPAEDVQSRFLSLEYEHLEYVFDSLERTTTQIRNIRAYLLTALYNAPTTVNQFYQAEIRHDFGAIATGF